MANGETIITPFNHVHGFPPDLRMQVANLNTRDTISDTVRWEGMPVYVIDQQTVYRLVGGITNSNWQTEFTASNATRTPVDNSYSTTSAMIADQGAQASGYIYFAAGGYYEYLGTTNNDITDYRKIADDEVLTLISSNLDIDSDIAGTIDAQWINSTGITRSVTSESVTFIGAPSAGNFRYDLVQGEDDGSVTVKSGTEGTEGGVTPPSKDPNTVILATVLWDDTGEGQLEPTEGAFINLRFNTAVTANSINKYAKVFELTTSGVNNYGFCLDYQQAAKFDDGSTGRVGRLNVNIICDNNDIAVIKMETVDGNSASGDWVMLENTTTNLISLYHKSTHYWGRVSFRPTFYTSLIEESNFISDESYAALPAADNQYDSTVFTVPASYPAAVERENNTVLFDKDYVIGNAGARTGNILFDFTGAQLGATTEMRHNDPGAFTFPTEAELMFDSGDISTTEDNYYLFVITDITASSEVVKVFHAMVGGVS